MERRITILLFCLLLFGTFKSIAQTFSAGNLVVLRNGDGSTPFTTASTAVTLLELTPTGATTSTSINLSSGAAGQRIVTSGTAGLEGQVRLSVDGRYLIVGGYDAAIGVTQATYETSTKIIVRIGVDGVPNYSTKIPTTDALNGATIRNAISVDGSSFWVAASNSTSSLGYYLRYIQFGASTSTAIDAFGTIARTLDIFNGALYATGFSSAPLTKYPGLPTTVSSSSSVTAFNFSASEFLFLDADKNPATGDANGNDVLYAADISNGLRKFAYVGGAWVGKGSLSQAGGVQTFTGYINSSLQPVLYAVRGAVGSNNSIVSITDASGITGDIGVTAPIVTTLATAGTNYSFRGIAFAPSPSITTSGTLTALSTTYGTASSSTSFNISGKNIVSGILITPPTGFEVSTDNVNFAGTTTLTGSGSITSTPVYIRLAASSAVGTYSGNIVLSSTGAISTNIATTSSTVTPVTFYSKATGDLAVLSTYGTSADGTGTAPTDFTGSGMNAVYQLGNRSSYLLTSNLSIGTGLIIPSGSTLDLAGNSLTTNTLSGTLTGSNTSSLILNGTVNSLAFALGKEQLNNLTLGNGASVTLTSDLNISSTGTISLAANATLNTNGNLTLKSNTSGTALVGTLGTGAAINGNVTVERYILDKRAWRLITTPVIGTQTINAAWQEGAGGTTNDPNPGYGTFMIGGSATNGFDYTGNASSLLSYDGVSTFSSVSGTGLAVSSKPGYFLFSAGSRSLNPTIATNHSSTTLRNTGTLRTGTQNLTVNASGFTLIGNPYAAPVDFSQVSRSSSVPNQFYAWDINLGTYGGYVLVSFSGGNYTSVPTSPSGLNNIIPSGAAIFVKSDGITVGSLAFNEASKATGAGSGSFRNFSVSEPATNTAQNLRINLTDGTSNLIDGVMANFASGNSNKLDNNDALKLPNFYENIALVRSGKLLTLERRSRITTNDTVFIQLSGVKETSYQLQIDPSGFKTQDMTAYFEDAYTHTSKKLDLEKVSNIVFTASADTASYKNRFKIVCKPAGSVLSFVRLAGSNLGKQIVLKWDVTGEDNIQVYTIEKWNGSAYSPVSWITAALAGSYSWGDKAVISGDNTYRITAKGTLGDVTSSNTITVKAAGLNAQVVAYPNPVVNKQVRLSFQGLPAGTYSITMTNAFGQIQQKTTMIYNGTASDKLLNVDYIKGIYNINIQSGAYNQSVKLMVQ